MASVSWVVGRGGLLGSAVARALSSNAEDVYDAPRVAWGTDAAKAELADALSQFFSLVGSGTWTIYWCAGAAVTDSSPIALERERATFHHFLDHLASHAPAILDNGVLVFASSAGAVYGGSSDPPFSESSAVAPLGHYGIAKLAAEHAVDSLARISSVRVVIARIANLYGPGQSIAKQQGLVSRLCVSAVTRTPISIYVSLDTLRHYIYVDDCAIRLIECARRARSSGADGATVKIVSTATAVSIGSVLGEIRRISPAKPLIVMGSSGAANLQSRDLRLRSTVWTDLDTHPETTLADGVARTMEDIRRSWLQSGRLTHTRA